MLILLKYFYSRNTKNSRCSFLFTILNSCKFHFLSFFIMGAYKFNVEVLTRAIIRIVTKNTIGVGSFISLIIGLIPAKVLATRLQMPIAVARLSIGKILLSMKLAKYDVKKPIAIPYLATKIPQGIHLWKKSSYAILFVPIYFECMFSK